MVNKDRYARENIEYSELCKTIRKMMREDIRQHNTLRVKEASETGRSLKRIINSKEGCKLQMLALKEQDGTIMTERDY